MSKQPNKLSGFVLADSCLALLVVVGGLSVLWANQVHYTTAKQRLQVEQRQWQGAYRTSQQLALKRRVMPKLPTDLPFKVVYRIE